MAALTPRTAGARVRDLNGTGTPEAVWERARLGDRLPRVDTSLLVPPGARAVVVAPHPDDEALGTGGLLASLGALGRTACVLRVTDGEASHPGSPRWTPASLAATRRAESRRGCARLGLGALDVASLGLPDGAVADHEAELGLRLAAYLRPNDVVFVTWSDDGHPDHEAAGRAAATAARARGAALVEVPVWAWHWGGPDDARIPWARALALPLGADARARKRAAIAEHRSQLEADPTTGRPAVLGAHDVAHFLRPFEVFFAGARRGGRAP